MAIAVLPALIQDIEAVYDAYFKAFAADPMGKLMLNVLFPNVDTLTDKNFRKGHAEGTLQWWHKSEQQYTWKIVDTTTGNIVGMALADIFLSARDEEERSFPEIGWLEGEAKERAIAVLKPLHEMREKLWGGRPFVYVHCIAVDPRHQGRKAGATICKWGIDLGDQLGLPIYFESSPSTVGLYEKMGYHRLKESIVHPAHVLGTDGDVEVPCMVKMPSYSPWGYEEWAELGFPVVQEH